MVQIRNAIILILTGIITCEKKVAPQEDFPFLVSIRRKFLEIKNFPSIHVCSGVIIGSDRILTAASCLHDFNGNFLHMPKSFEIYAGTNSLSEDVSEETQIMYSKLSKTSPGFRYGHLDGDLGIIIIENNFQLNNVTVQVAKTKILDPGSFKINCSIFGRYANTKVIDKNKLTDKLYTTTVETNRDCGAYLYQDGFLNNKSHFLCAGSPLQREDTCFEDTGAPLVCSQEVVGIAVAYTNCKDGQKSTAYIEIARYPGLMSEGRNLPVLKSRGTWKHQFPIALGMSFLARYLLPQFPATNH